MPDPINLAASAPYYAAALLFGYLLGSIPFGLILTRMAGLGDVRSIGSGNIGATNVLRTGRKDIAAATLLLDAAKGAAAVLLAAQFGPATAAFAGLGALIGHCYPLWLRFRGGKGVATFLGILIGLSVPHALLFAALWLATAFAFRFSSLAALVAASAVPLAAFISPGWTGLSDIALAEVSALMVLLILWKHRENIRRLLAGTESRIGAKGRQAAARTGIMIRDDSPWPQLDDRQRLDWLQLIRTPRIGPATFRDLINHFGSASRALAALPNMTARRGHALRAFDRTEAEREMDDAKRLGARFVAIGEAGYPAHLAATERPPPLLCIKGEPQRDHSATLAIVGSRNASAGGLSLAKAWAGALGQAGFVIVSGLARGIDAAAHLGALSTGTWAFCAGGLAQPYPPEHAGLADRIAASGGALYSEMPLSWSARAQDFPRRNRLVAGASLGLIVVEANRRSGSLITARQALDLGREVMAVPGFPLDQRSDGPNSLIRDGARLVRTPEDVMDEMAPLLRSKPEQGARHGSLIEAAAMDHDDTALPEINHQHAVTDEVERELLLALSHVPVSIDTLCEATGVPVALARGWLLESELAGMVVRHERDTFALNAETLRPGA